MSPGVVALVCALAVGVLLSVFKSRFDGRFRGTRKIRNGRRDVRRNAESPADAARLSVGEQGAEAWPGAGQRTVDEPSPGRVTPGELDAGRVTADGLDTGRVAAGELDAERVTAGQLDAELGERATLLQFSSAFCAPCRATRRVLGEVAEMVDGVRHVEVDAEAHLELVRRLDILRTPTVLVLDSTGAVVTRASGQPRKPDVIAALGQAVDRQPH